MHFCFGGSTSSPTICKVLSSLALKASSNDQCHLYPSASSITALSIPNLTPQRIKHGYHKQYISEAISCFVLSVVPTEEEPTSRHRYSSHLAFRSDASHIFQLTKMQINILSPLLSLSLSLLLTTTLTSPTPLDLNMDIITIEHSTTTSCQCVRACYNNLKAYCDSCASITDQFL